MAQVPLQTRMEMGILWVRALGIYAGGLVKMAMGNKIEGKHDIAIAKGFMRQSRSEPRWYGEKGYPNKDSETKI